MHERKGNPLNRFCLRFILINCRECNWNVQSRESEWCCRSESIKLNGKSIICIDVKFTWDFWISSYNKDIYLLLCATFCHICLQLMDDIFIFLVQKVIAKQKIIKDIVMMNRWNSSERLHYQIFNGTPGMKKKDAGNSLHCIFQSLRMATKFHRHYLAVSSGIVKNRWSINVI